MSKLANSDSLLCPHCLYALDAIDLRTVSENAEKNATESFSQHQARISQLTINCPECHNSCRLRVDEENVWGFSLQTNVPRTTKDFRVFGDLILMQTTTGIFELSRSSSEHYRMPMTEAELEKLVTYAGEWLQRLKGNKG